MLTALSVLAMLVWGLWRQGRVVRRHKLARDRALAIALIAAKGCHGQKFVGQDDRLRQQSEERRQGANRLRRRALDLESGVSLADRLRRVK